ncbi:SIS domain-containing protein [Microbacterium oleivorans]|uniref:Sugar isomerase n=1 Tax=Microbacterium oleivorans TaxID=273677 RepID=A0A7D5IQR9_9MICO|nr:sugar isomerase [Microbacterium oleivorans]QLD11961.1 sugar isomerase [Microbacterium oleivorans]
MAETGTQTISPLRGAHMEAELVSQPDCWERAAQVARDAAVLPNGGLRVAAVGCGTSWFMAQSYAALREAAGHGPTDAFAASEAPVAARDYDVVVLITRSGTTTEVLELAAELRGRVRTVGIVGDTSSPFPDAVDGLVALPFADETSVVQTRFATSALSALRASVGHDVAASVADARRALAADLPTELLDAEQITLLGRGWTTGLAHEAALKMREASQSWTEAYPAMEYRHGPISIAAPGRVVWSFGPTPDGLVGDVAATGAHFEMSDADPLAELVRAQRVALARARARGLDPDRPRNLTRSVILG